VPFFACKLRATSYELRATSHELQATSYELRATSNVVILSGDAAKAASEPKDPATDCEKINLENFFITANV
jgi:hypothetical protein